MAEAPIGTIMAYAGPTNVGEFESATGWMLCDGRELDRHNTANAALFNAIGFSWGGDGVDRFNLPDLQGLFLRGVDERHGSASKDPDNESRTENRPGGHHGASVGSVQNYATAPPTSQDFRVSDNGTHRHLMNFQINATRDVGGTGNTVANPAPSPAAQPITEQAGSHTHNIRDDSGDRETRPINAYVNWIIRFK